MVDNSKAHDATGEVSAQDNVATKQENSGDQEELPLLEYSPLDIDTKEMRFLILEPHHGDPDSLVKCSFSFQPLSSCEPYTYVINTRGNPLAWLGFPIDGHLMVATRNIVIFLGEIRSRDTVKRLWFRDVCLNHKDPDEKARYWNQEWMDTMVEHAEKVIDLSEVVAELWDRGKLPRPFPMKSKLWNETRELKETKHHPAPLHMQKGWVEPPPPHEYLPLDYVCDEFRLIALWKADHYNDPLVASLSYSVMHDDVTYHCLSYNWGPSGEDATCSILLNGQAFKIRKNLDACLREIRDNSHKYVIWIDAICIDQNNISERNRQIPRMLEIYDAADVVISWIGESDENSDIAIDFLDNLQSPKLQPDEEGNWGPYRTKEGDEWKIEPIPDLPRGLAAIYQFFLRSYFRRIWIIQELAVANHPFAFCGKKRVAWSKLDHAAYNLIDILHRDKSMSARMMAVDPNLSSISDKELSFVRRLFYFRHLRSKNIDSFFGTTTMNGIKDTSPGILDAMVLSRDFQSTSPYDKIFALLNLAEDIEEMDFKPDYSKSLSQTYQEFAVAVARKTQSLDIICAAEHSTKAMLDMPDWCADWSTPATISSLIRHDRIPDIIFMSAVKDASGPIYNACGPSTLTSRFEFIETVLEVTGFIFDTVKIVQQRNEDSSASNFIGEWMSTAFNECQTQEQQDTPSLNTPFMDQFWSMVAGDSTGVWSIETVPREERPSGTNDLEKTDNVPFRPVCVKEKESKHSKLSSSTIAFDVVTKGRALIITEKGLMGLAPFYAKLGHKVAILSKCSVPVLLEENEDGTYGFRGSAFVQGWMEGEELEKLGLNDEDGWQKLENGGRLKVV